MSQPYYYKPKLVIGDYVRTKFVKLWYNYCNEAK